MYQSPTAQLYEPLRSTLDRSIAQHPILELSKSRAYEQMGATSRISRRMRSLSPEEATYIVRMRLISRKVRRSCPLTGILCRRITCGR